MKTHEPQLKTIGDNSFYIRPFGAFKAANISGELFSIILPVLGGVIPSAAKAFKNENVFDSEVELDAQSLAAGLSSLNGDKIESLMRLLLVKHNNIGVELDDSTNAVPLTNEIVDRIFCGEVQNMYLLAAEVIKVNFNGFFKSLGNLFGSRAEGMVKTMTAMTNMAN